MTVPSALATALPFVPLPMMVTDVTSIALSASVSPVSTVVVTAAPSLTESESSSATGGSFCGVMVMVTVATLLVAADTSSTV